jgi:hypothetical protein
MKTFIITLLFLGLALSSYSQDKMMKDGEGPIKAEELPAIVIKRAGTDFSVYIPSGNTDSDVKALEQKFVAYDIGKDYEGFENYLLIMDTKDGSLNATYNENGKLVRVVENYKNVKLPNEVVFSIYRTYPEWKIVNDKFLYTQEEGDIINNLYNLKLEKGKQTLRIKIRANGEIIKVR